MNPKIQKMINTLRELPAGEPIRYHAWNGVIGEVVRKKSALTTDDLSQLADYIERVEAMLAGVRNIRIGDGLLYYTNATAGNMVAYLDGKEPLPPKWYAAADGRIGNSTGPYDSVLEAYEALKENTDAN